MACRRQVTQFQRFAGADHGRVAGGVCLDELHLHVQALQASYAFANTLKKDDWVAVTYYDMQPHILVDFTQDKKAVYGALNQLRIPGFAETNLFDALYDTLDRLDRVEGKKYVILVTTGVDTFSKLTLDKIMKKIKDTKDVTIFPISIGFIVARILRNSSGLLPQCAWHGHPVGHMDYLQGDNEMRTFAAMTGGRAYFPRFRGASCRRLFSDIANDIRNQYTISYHPTNTKLDGTYRKLKVQVVAPDGGPLKVRDQKGKDVKIEVCCARWIHGEAHGGLERQFSTLSPYSTVTVSPQRHSVLNSPVVALPDRAFLTLSD